MTTKLRVDPLIALAGLVALTLVLPFAGAATTPAFVPPNPNNPPQQWAYGAVWAGEQYTNGSITSGVTSYSYELVTHGFVSWNLIFTQTNFSSTSFMVEANRTLAASLFIQGCSPNCANPVAQANITASGWEEDYAFANFSTAYPILVNGTQMLPGISLVNEHITVAANLTGQSNWNGARAGSGGNAYVSEAVNAAATVDFTPPLGLAPQNVSVGQSWVSASNYTATGSYDKTCHGYDSSVGAASCAASGTLSGSGAVSLYGVDTGYGFYGPRHLWYPGHVLVYTVTNALTNTYTFDVVDGIVLLPHSTNLFASSSAGASPTGTTSTAGISESSVDVLGGSHLGIEASSATFATTADTGALSSVGGLTAASPLASSAPAGLSPSGAESIQAVPESVATAVGNDHCLTTDLCVSPTPSGGHGGAFLLFVVGLVAVAAVVVALVVRQRRSGPKGPRPSPTPAAAGAAPYAATLAARPPNGSQVPPRGPTQDPLGNLW